MLDTLIEYGYHIGSLLLFIAAGVIALSAAYFVVRSVSRYFAQQLEVAHNRHMERVAQSANVTAIKLQETVTRLEAELQAKEAAVAEQRGVSDRSQEAIEFAFTEYNKLLLARLTTQNFATSKKKLVTLMDKATAAGCAISPRRRQEILDALQEEYEAVLRREYAKQEQARIKERIREEARAEAERQRELQRLENEELAIENALQKALRKAQNEHAEEVMRLQEKLAEAQTRLERAKSQAQLTKAGFIYVISNIGSFGEGIFKVGMTRRLEPMDRIRELGDASVPFPFDVHMMISCDNAPELESALHRALNRQRVNRVNFRKEYFRANLDEIVQIVKDNHGEVEYVADPEALEYRNSVEMDDHDFDALSDGLEAATVGGGVEE